MRCSDCGVREGEKHLSRCPRATAWRNVVEDAHTFDFDTLSISREPHPWWRTASQATLTEQFDAALSAATNVTKERGEVYGHPYDDFGRAAALKAVVAECPDERIRHVLEMICTKMARLIHSPDHLDSWIDVAGYARTAVMVLDKRAIRDSA